MGPIEFTANTESDTEQLGAALGKCLPDGTVCLTGTLGAGKTRLVQAVARACAVPVELVLSPTFTLCNEYHGSRKINHFDLYRIRDEDELIELGLDEYFDSSAMTFVEWGERFAAALPLTRIDIGIQLLESDQRRFTLVPRGAIASDVWLRLSQALASS